MRIKRSIFALLCTSTLIFAGCSSADSDGSSGSESGDFATENTPEDGQTSEDDADDDGDTPAPGDTENPEAPEPDVADIPDVVATVNDADITRDQFLVDYEAQFQQAVMMSQGEELDQDVLKQNVVDMLINRELLIQAAAADGIEASADKVDEVLQDAAAQSGLESVEDFLAVAEEQGIDEEMMRKDAGLQYVINTYIDENVDVPDAPEDELRAQYDEVVELLKQQGSAEDEIPDFDAVRDQLNDEAKNMEMTAAVDDLLAQLREAADVKVLI